MEDRVNIGRNLLYRFTQLIISTQLILLIITLISERNERINLVNQIVTFMQNNKYRNTLLRPTINASNCTWHTNRSLLKM